MLKTMGKTIQMKTMTTMTSEFTTHDVIVKKRYMVFCPLSIDSESDIVQSLGVINKYKLDLFVCYPFR